MSIHGAMSFAMCTTIEPPLESDDVIELEEAAWPDADPEFQRRGVVGADDPACCLHEGDGTKGP